MSGYFQYRNTSEVRVYRAGLYKRSPNRTSPLIAVAMFLALCLDVAATAQHPSRNPNATSLRQTWSHAGHDFKSDRRPDAVLSADPAVSSSSSAAELHTDSHSVTEKPTSNHSPSFSNTSSLRRRTTWATAESHPKTPIKGENNQTNVTNADPERITASTVRKTTIVSLSRVAVEFGDPEFEDKKNPQPTPMTASPVAVSATSVTLLSNPGEKPDPRKIQHHLYSVRKHVQHFPTKLLRPDRRYGEDRNSGFKEQEESAQIRLDQHELLLQQELQQQQQLIQDQVWRHSHLDWVNPPPDGQFHSIDEQNQETDDHKTKVKAFLESNESIITKLKLVTTTSAVSSNASAPNNVSSTLPSISPTSLSPGKAESSNETVKVGSTSGPMQPPSASVVALYNTSAPSSEAPWIIVPPAPSLTDPACNVCSCPRQGGIYLLDCTPQLRVKDDCGCCTVCLRAVHQPCGGIYQGFGKCAADLECVPLDSAGYQSTRYDLQETHGHTQDAMNGTCHPKGKDDDPCRNVGCDTSIKYQCPKDSRLTSNTSVSTGGSTSAESCCKHRLACLCNMDLCDVPMCGPGFTAQMIHKGTGKPGNCCDQFECKRNEKCADVICEEPQDCPSDSLKVSQELSKDGCCFSDPACVCPSRDKCLPVECPLHFNIMVVQKATRKPGSCCDKFKCVSNKSESCYSDGRTYAHNSEWKLDNCTKCKCDNRLIYCETQTCNSPQCSWMKTPEGECCPVCKGCMANGNLYKNNESWKEDDCVTCRCNEGIVECQTAMCSVPCLNPRRVPGQCCPVCESNCSFSCKYGYATDSQNREICECAKHVHKCPLLSTCKRRCTYGYKRTRHGCFRCKCNVCPLHECSKKCIYGYLTDARGCRICGCKGKPSFGKTTPHVSVDLGKTIAPRRKTSCLSNGLYYKNGEMWNDGCRECYCKEGKELCSLIACSVPPCSNPIYRIGDCCPSCPGTEPISSKERYKQEICHGENGNEYVEGEVWELEKCTTCLCHHGIILCNTEMCPPQLCHFPIKVAGQCCAFCPRKVDKPSRVPQKLLKHCLLDGKPAFKHGEVWRSNPCQSCTCRHGHVHCFSQTCPALSCNQTVLRKGQCCATCSVKESITSASSLTDNFIRKPTSNNLIDTDPADDTSYIIVIAILALIICGVFGLLCLLLFNKYRKQT